MKMNEFIQINEQLYFASLQYYSKKINEITTIHSLKYYLLENIDFT